MMSKTNLVKGPIAEWFPKRLPTITKNNSLASHQILTWDRAAV